MKRVVFIVLMSLSLNANNLVEDIASTSLMSSQKSFESGSYDLKDNSDLDDFHFSFRYNFESDSSINYFIGSSVGLNSYTNPVTTLELDSTVLSIEGGGRLKLNDSSYLSIATGIIYSDIETNLIANKDLDALTYQANIRYDYENSINDYDMYMTLFSGYYYTKVDDLAVDNSSSIISHIKVGGYSPELIQIYNLPFKVELYAQETFLSKDISDNLDIDNFTTVGMAFHLYTNTIVPLVDNVYLDINYVKGDNIEGLHIGLALSF